MKCPYCKQMTQLRLAHMQECADNPENMPEITVTYCCGHEGQRTQFPDDEDGAKLAEFLEDRECDACFLEGYRTAQANRTPEQVAEHMFELEAAFGPGVEVVNVVTNLTYLT